MLVGKGAVLMTPADRIASAPRAVKAWALDNEGRLDMPLVVARSKKSIVQFCKAHGYGKPMRVTITPRQPTPRKP